MSLNPLDAIAELGKSAIERIWPDPIDRAREVRLLEELRAAGDSEQLNAHVKLMLAQIKVNEVSASHKSLFVSGARPAVIWVGVFAMFWSGVVHPLLTWYWALADIACKAPTVIDGVMVAAGCSPPPLIEAAALTAIVTGLLGVGGMRSYDKGKGTAKDSL